VLQQVREELELGRGEVHVLARLADVAPVDVDLDRAESQRCRRSTVGGAIDSAEQRVHPGRQLPGAERLGKVVVRTDGEPDHQVGLRVPCREHQHGHGTIALDAPAHLEAVEAREHEIQHDEVGAEPFTSFDRGEAIAGDLDGEALAAQPGRDRFGDRQLVFHHEHRASRAGDAARCQNLGHRRPC